LLIQPSDCRFGVFVVSAVEDGDACIPGLPLEKHPQSPDEKPDACGLTVTPLKFG
jgi:hypothetical protein